jgi:hypothetical protein
MKWKSIYQNSQILIRHTIHAWISEIYMCTLAYAQAHTQSPTSRHFVFVTLAISLPACTSRPLSLPRLPPPPSFPLSLSLTPSLFLTGPVEVEASFRSSSRAFASSPRSLRLVLSSYWCVLICVRIQNCVYKFWKSLDRNYLLITTFGGGRHFALHPPPRYRHVSISMHLKMCIHTEDVCVHI